MDGFSKNSRQFRSWFSLIPAQNRTVAKEDKVTHLPSAFHLGAQKVLGEYKGIKDILQMRLNKSSGYYLE